MANEQTTVPLYAASEVLTAANMNISAGTGVPVFATTVTRDAGFGGANKALAEGQLCYLSATDVVQYYDGAAWATVGPAAAASSGLNLVATGTLTAAASVTVNTCFTSTYNEYLLLVDILGTATGTLTMQMRNAGSTITSANYQWYRTGFNNSGATDNLSASAQSNWLFGYVNSVVQVVAGINIYNPLASRVSQHTALSNSANAGDTATAVYTTGFRYTSAQVFDSFVLTASAGTMTGTVRVYGYNK